MVYTYTALTVFAYNLLKVTRYADSYDYSACDRGDDRNLLELYW